MTSLTDFPAPCVLITGMPGAGKSSVSHLLAQRMPRAARLSADTVAAMLVSGRVWALGEPADEARRQVRLAHTNLGSLARNTIDAGFAAVIDAVIPDGEQLAELLEPTGHPAPLLVVLAPGIRACQQRNAGRAEDERWEFTGYEDLEARMREGFGDRGWWLDTAELTLEATVELIIAEAADRAPLTFP